ncbi:MAG: NADH-quinone oxidoreductase subunit H, partial [Deltaproteobacteria bacterium]|nr:NADH-quinone oxidoreductase subunit H [Deltaproteobacteria bacterium]
MNATSTPSARLASADQAPEVAPKRTVGNWLGWQIGGWAVFIGFLVGTCAALLLIVRGLAQLDGVGKPTGGLFESIGNVVVLLLVFVMVLATLLTLADRKWSALMQDRVGPNRARFPGIDSPLAGTPHIVADVLKMLFKEDFISIGARKSKVLFNLGPFLAFAPAFCLFAVVPMSPVITLWGKQFALQVARLDWGILYVFALASLGVFGTALAGWSSDNKLALLGGLRASAQLISYEVTLGLTLVGTFIVFGTLRLDDMVVAQGMAQSSLGLGTDNSLVLGWLPAWGILFQPIGALLFIVAAMAEIKRAPFDTPEGESEIIGYFLEYSGLKSGMFLIAEYVETVVVAGIVTSMFLGGWHIPYFEPALFNAFKGAGSEWATLILATLQVFAFLVKTLIVIWLMFLARWAFPRSRC